MKLIIWSRDRACQLETLINSALPIGFDIHVIYSYTSEIHRESYEVLQKEYPDITLHHQIDGQGKFIFSSIFHNDEFFTISCDDVYVFDNDFTTKEVEEYMSGIDVFSLRYGLNTIIQDVFRNNLEQPPLNRYSYYFDDVIEWNTRDYHPLMNYGYPFGLDMHTYRSSVFRKMTRFIEFDRPPELEGGLNKYRNSIVPIIRSFETSKAVCVPLNNLSGNTKSYGPGVNELVVDFLNGKRLRFKETEINACHQLLEYELV